MGTNTNLTNEIAVKLIRSEKTVCPKCGDAELVSRYRYKGKNTEYKCPNCKEIYHPCKMI